MVEEFGLDQKRSCGLRVPLGRSDGELQKALWLKPSAFYTPVRKLAFSFVSNMCISEKIRKEKNIYL